MSAGWLQLMLVTTLPFSVVTVNRLSLFAARICVLIYLFIVSVLVYVWYQ